MKWVNAFLIHKVPVEKLFKFMFEKVFKVVIIQGGRNMISISIWTYC